MFYSVADLVMYYRNTVVQFEGILWDVPNITDEAQLVLVHGPREEYVDPDDITPYWLDGGYYDYTKPGVHSTVVYYMETLARRQYKKSFHQELCQLRCPNVADAMCANQNTRAHMTPNLGILRLLKRGDMERIESKLAGRYCSGVALSRDLAIIKPLFLKAPVLLYRNITVGYLSNMKVLLLPKFHYLIELVAEHIEVEIHQDD